jgi:hypothetical protein
VTLTVPIVLGLDSLYQGYALMLAPNGPVSDVSFQVATEDDAAHLAAQPEQWVKVNGTIYYERQPPVKP